MTPPTEPQFSDSLEAAKLLYGDGPYTPAKIRDIALATHLFALKAYEAGSESPEAEDTTSTGTSEMMEVAEPAVVETAVVESPVHKTRVKRKTKPSESTPEAEPDQQPESVSESSVDSAE